MKETWTLINVLLLVKVTEEIIESFLLNIYKAKLLNNITESIDVTSSRHHHFDMSLSTTQKVYYQNYKNDKTMKIKKKRFVQNPRN